MFANNLSFCSLQRRSGDTNLNLNNDKSKQILVASAAAAATKMTVNRNRRERERKRENTKLSLSVELCANEKLPGRTALPIRKPSVRFESANARNQLAID